MANTQAQARRSWKPVQWLDQGELLPKGHAICYASWNSRHGLSAVVPLSLVIALVVWSWAFLRTVSYNLSQSPRVAYDQGTMHGWKQARPEIEDHRELVVALDNLTDDEGNLPWLPPSPQREHLERTLASLRFRLYPAAMEDDAVHWAKVSRQPFHALRTRSWDPPPQTRKWWEEHITSNHSKSGTPGSI